MQKANKKSRDIKYRSEKNQGVLIVHSNNARCFSKYLEADDEIESYKVCVDWDLQALQLVQKTQIRNDYFNQQWMTDFLIKYKDGTIAVREITTYQMLEELSEIERLELSRRYWFWNGITDWKAVIIKGRASSCL